MTQSKMSSHVKENSSQTIFNMTAAADISQSVAILAQITDNQAKTAANMSQFLSYMYSFADNMSQISRDMSWFKKHMSQAIKSMSSTSMTMTKSANVMSKAADNITQTSFDLSQTASKISISADNFLQTADSMSQTADSMAQNAHKIAKNVNRMAETADNIEQIADNMSKATDSIAQTANNMSQTAVSMSQNADNIGQTAKSLLQTSENIARTTDSMSQTAVAISQTADGMSKTAIIVSQSIDCMSQTADGLSVAADGMSQTAVTISQTADNIARNVDGIAQTEDGLSQTAITMSQTADNIARNVNSMSQSADNIVRKVDSMSKAADGWLQTTHNLSQTADNLSQTAVTMSQTADNFAKSADSISHTSHHMSKTADVMSETATEMSSNVEIMLDNAATISQSTVTLSQAVENMSLIKENTSRTKDNPSPPEDNSTESGDNTAPTDDNISQSAENTSLNANNISLTANNLYQPINGIPQNANNMSQISTSMSQNVDSMSLTTSNTPQPVGGLSLDSNNLSETTNGISQNASNTSQAVFSKSDNAGTVPQTINNIALNSSSFSSNVDSISENKIRDSLGSNNTFQTINTIKLTAINTIKVGDSKYESRKSISIANEKLSESEGNATHIKDQSHSKEKEQQTLDSMLDPTDSDVETSVNLLLIGEFCQGKSSVGNSLLGGPAFKSKSSPQAVTKSFQLACKRYGQFNIRVVDSPGFNVLDEKTEYENLSKIVSTLKGGVHAFVYVKRFPITGTNEKENIFPYLQKLFGNNVINEHGIVVVTGGDKFNADRNKTFQEWWRKLPGELFQKCSPRIVLFNNVTGNQQAKETQKNELLQHVVELVQRNGSYTREQFLESSKVLQDVIRRNDIQFYNYIRWKINSVEVELRNLPDDLSLEDVVILEASIRDLQHVIEDYIPLYYSCKVLNGHLLNQQNLIQDLTEAIGDKNSTRIAQIILDLREYCKIFEEIRKTEWAAKSSANGGDGALDSSAVVSTFTDNKISRTYLNLILIGKTGVGKSSVGNSILGYRAFCSGSSTRSVTKEVKSAWGMFAQYDLLAIDSPGLTEAEDKKKAYENMSKALLMAIGGVHAFIFVNNFMTPFTEEDREVISELKDMFGERYLKDHGIFVATRGDQFQSYMEEEATPHTFEQWWQKNVNDLFKECSPRIVLFNNRTKDKQVKDDERNELLQNVVELYQKNGLYTYEHFEMCAKSKKENVTVYRDAVVKWTNAFR